MKNIKIKPLRIICLFITLASTSAAYSQKIETGKKHFCSSISTYDCAVDLSWARLNRWIRSWVEHEVDEYLSFYVPNQSPKEGMTFQDWRAQRIERVGRQKKISIRAFAINVEVVPKELVRLTIAQSYQSGSYQDFVIKEVDFKLIEDELYIAREHTTVEISEQEFNRLSKQG